MKFLKINSAFTLAEVLITLAIIGVVAALTIGVVVKNYQQTALKTQFKKVYSTLQNGWLKAQVDMGYQPDCYYWNTNPYGGGAICVTRNPDTGYCTKYEMPDGSDLPSDYNGIFKDCTIFKNQLAKSLGVGKTCKTNALSGGCVPEYEGNDSVFQASSPDATPYDVGVKVSGCSGWTKNNIATTRESWVLNDGTIIVFYSGPQIFAVDINGKKKPNRWGYDLFGFQTVGNKNSYLKIYPGGCMPIESGGVNTTTMLKNSLK